MMIDDDNDDDNNDDNKDDDGNDDDNDDDNDDPGRLLQQRRHLRADGRGRAWYVQPPGRGQPRGRPQWC